MCEIALCEVLEVHCNSASVVHSLNYPFHNLECQLRFELWNDYFSIVGARMGWSSDETTMIQNFSLWNHVSPKAKLYSGEYCYKIVNILKVVDENRDQGWNEASSKCLAPSIFDKISELRPWYPIQKLFDTTNTITSLFFFCKDRLRTPYMSRKIAVTEMSSWILIFLSDELDLFLWNNCNFLC